jgi:hypothetical protein
VSGPDPEIDDMGADNRLELGTVSYHNLLYCLHDKYVRVWVWIIRGQHMLLTDQDFMERLTVSS